MKLHTVLLLKLPGEPLSCEHPFDNVVAVTLLCAECKCTRELRVDPAEYLLDTSKAEEVECLYYTTGRSD